MKVQSCCELLYLIVLLWMLELETLLLSILVHLCAKSPPFFDHFSPFGTLLQKLPQADIYASIYISKFDIKVIFHCLNLNFSPTKWFSVLTDCLILSLPSVNNPGLVMRSVVVVNTLAVDEVAPIRPINFVNSKTVFWGWEKRLWHFKINLFHCFPY